MVKEEKKVNETPERPHEDDGYDLEHLEVDESAADYDAEETNAKEKKSDG